MPRDPERLDRLQTAMEEAGLDAIVCSLPQNVLLLTGYFPVVGTSLAFMTQVVIAVAAGGALSLLPHHIVEACAAAAFLAGAVVLWRQKE